MFRKYLLIVVVFFGILSCENPDSRLMEASFLTRPTPKIEALLAKMTLEEKVGQMAQVTLDVITKGETVYVSDEPLELDLTLVKEAILDYKVGSILNTANNRARTIEQWNTIVSEIQDIAVNQSRLGIPVIYGIDAIHGATYTAGATFFPQQIGLAATWNRELVRQGAEITAYETRASGIPWNFSPVLDLGRDPRFPRMWETFGEDIYLASEMGKQMIKGYEGQKNEVSVPTKVASTLKHFLGYSVPYTGKDRTPAFIPEMELRERHLPAFQAAIEAGAHSVMINSGIINGVPVHANKDIITNLLKGELNFKGVVVTDWKDIDNLHFRDKVAATRKEAVKMAVNANAWDVIGTVSKDVADATGLNSSCVVHVGVHDSNASYLRYLLSKRNDEFCVISTGTWVVCMSSQESLGCLDSSKDMLANINVEGQPVPCIRFMGGREYEMICSLTNCSSDQIVNDDDIKQIIVDGVMALPSFSNGNGPYGKNRSEILGIPKNGAALATIYCALMISCCLNKLNTQGDVIMDGSFLKNPILCRLVAQLCGKKNLYISNDEAGTVKGAAQLTQWSQLPILELEKCEPYNVEGLDLYVSSWFKAIGEIK